MDLGELKQRLEGLEDAEMAELVTFPTPFGAVTVWITARLRKACRKGKVWKSPGMLTALKNAAYGLDPTRQRSRGGADGIFLLDRAFRPENEMMRRVFDRFLDKPDPLVATIAKTFGVAPGALSPVRVVSHHLRLLGVLTRQPAAAQLVLVDYDETE